MSFKRKALDPLAYIWGGLTVATGAAGMQTPKALAVNFGIAACLYFIPKVLFKENEPSDPNLD